MSKTKIVVTGASGMIGQALVKQLKKEEAQLFTPSHAQLDLCNQAQVFQYFEQIRPHYVFHLAAKVGGIHANKTYPAQFIYENTQMHCNVIQGAYLSNVKKLLFPGSACTYPKYATQPIKESELLNGHMEVTNLAYGMAKMNGIIMCQSYREEYRWNAIVPMPTNSYGPGDNFDPMGSHVIPGLMKRFHDALIQGRHEVSLWGSGTPLREFIYVDDLASALIFLMHHYDSSEIINVGTMQEISMLDLAKKIAKVVGFQGLITLDRDKPDGTPRKCLDSSKLFNLGWRAKVNLDEGLQNMFEYHFINEGNSRAARA